MLFTRQSLQGVRRFSNYATPALVKELRMQTGSPLKDCMAALKQTQGDMEASKDYLRKKALQKQRKELVA